MTTKTFLTSCVAMGFIAPVMAAPTNTGTFPSGGLMQADYTYTNAATSTNMDGVYEGTVNAVAEYEDVLYNIAAGRYLARSSELTNGTECPAGSWCPGLTNATYNASNDQGINTCPTGYTGSATGSSANTDCFRICETTDITHSTAITGNVYYNGTDGDGVNTCEPTNCENGWHVKEGLNLKEHINNATIAGYIAINQGTLKEIRKDGTAKKGAEYYGISGDTNWAVDYGDKGIINGQNRCGNELRSGWYPCYCKITGYKASGDQNFQTLIYDEWVLFNEDGNGFYASNSYNSCTQSCSSACAIVVMGLINGYRDEILSGVTPTPASCAANTITINWGDTDLADVTANEAGTATYGSDIRTPVKAQTKAGKRFTGWRFSKPTQTTLP